MHRFFPFQEPARVLHRWPLPMMSGCAQGSKASAKQSHTAYHTPRRALAPIFRPSTSWDVPSREVTCTLGILSCIANHNDRRAPRLARDHSSGLLTRLQMALRRRQLYNNNLDMLHTTFEHNQSTWQSATAAASPSTSLHHSSHYFMSTRANTYLFSTHVVSWRKTLNATSMDPFPYRKAAAYAFGSKHLFICVLRSDQFNKTQQRDADSCWQG